MGELFAVLTSCCFGSSNVSIRRGMQQHAAPDNGIFTVNFTNAILFNGMAFSSGYGEHSCPLTGWPLVCLR